jgi:ribosomal protein L19E
LWQKRVLVRPEETSEIIDAITHQFIQKLIKERLTISKPLQGLMVDKHLGILKG